HGMAGDMGPGSRRKAARPGRPPCPLPGCRAEALGRDDNREAVRGVAYAPFSQTILRRLMRPSHRVGGGGSERCKRLPSRRNLCVCLVPLHASFQEISTWWVIASPSIV